MVSKKSVVRPIPITRPHFSRLESFLVSRAIASGWISQGKLIEDFERSLANYTGARHAVAVSSGTTALHLALLISGIGPGDEVIAPSFSFIATANSILYCGARPMFIDIDLNTYNIDPLKIVRFLEDECRYDVKRKRLVNKRTLGVVKAIMPVHQFGLPCDLDAIGEAAKKYDLAVIEDAACALGSSYKARKIGDGKNIACFSFHPRKIITTGEGGAILTNNRIYADKVRALRNHGAVLSAEDYETLGYNYRLTDLQGAIGIAQMSKLSMILKSRKYLAGRYDEAFRNIKGIHLPFVPDYAASNFQSYVLLVSDKCRASRDAIVTKLLRHGISTRRGNTAIHLQSLYKSMGFQVRLPNTEKAALGTMALPIYTEMTRSDQDFVIASLVSILGE